MLYYTLEVTIPQRFGICSFLKIRVDKRKVKAFKKEKQNVTHSPIYPLELDINEANSILL